MEEQNIKSLVLRLLVEVAPEAKPQDLRPDLNFRDQLDFDSIDFLNFVMAIEKAMGIHIPEYDYPKLSSLEGCVRYLSAHAG